MGHILPILYLCSVHVCIILNAKHIFFKEKLKTFQFLRISNSIFRKFMLLIHKTIRGRSF